MKLTRFAFVGMASLGLGLGACTTTVTAQNGTGQSSAPASSSPTSPSSSPSPHTSHSPLSNPGIASTPSPNPSPNVTDPWAVVSAYYGDIESGDYQQAWALIGSGATTGQTYQQFVNGFACTGGQTLSEVGESGDQVSFNLTADNTCTGQTQQYSGTDTVQGGKIVAANVTQTG
jgi:hypothetical protein